MTENFSKLMMDTRLNIQQLRVTQQDKYKKKPSPKHIIFKIQNIKEKILEEVGG